MSISFGIITISDRGARGEREDESGAMIEEMMAPLPSRLLAKTIIPDEKEQIISVLKEYADVKRLDLILTTGGTGLSPRDVTPEATREVLEREIPGLIEMVRREGALKTPFAALSRAMAGVRGRSLIINLPGSPKAVEENLRALMPVLNHAIEKIQGDMRDCAR